MDFAGFMLGGGGYRWRDLKKTWMNWLGIQSVLLGNK
jgi:hypothetical protein